jgi:hypothetical protein
MSKSENKVARPKPLMELVDLGTLYVVAANGEPSKGCGCTPPTRLKRTV